MSRQFTPEKTSLVQTVDITRVAVAGWEQTSDVVVPEYALHLNVNGKPIATLMCLPEALRELVTGFLISEGLVRIPEDIRSISINEDKGEASATLADSSDMPLKLYGRRTVHTGCGSPPLFPRTLDSLRSRTLPDSPPLSVLELSEAMQQLQHASELFNRTGGVHSAAICLNGQLRFFRDDVGRHNAVDKVAGEAAMHGIERSRCALLCSGRISSDLVTKAAVHGIPIVVSRSAATGRAVEIALSLNMGLVGFARGRRMNIYSGISRFDLGEANELPGRDAEAPDSGTGERPGEEHPENSG